MNNKGFVKLSRDILDWECFGNNNALLVLIRLTLAAAWCDTRYFNVKLSRGQVATTISEIARTNQLSIQQARTAINHLKASGKITVRAMPKFSIITLVDYDCNSNDNSESYRSSNGNQPQNQQPTNSPTLLYKEKRNEEAEEYARTRASGAAQNVFESVCEE
ncbi:MAG: hypothetical protein ACI4Q4_03355 [Oscillospiraceae bacterium]